jgi:hypothetical protein
MRGGGIGATREAFPMPLGSTDILSNALIAAAFGRLPATPAKCPVAPGLPPRANVAAGMAKTTRSAKAIFIEVFDMEKLHRIHGNAVCVKPM